MSTFITLVRFINEEIEDVRHGPDRLDQYKSLFTNMGAEVKAFYMTTGEYDAVVISEARDYVTIAKLSLAIGSYGNVRTETLPALTEDEYRAIMSDLP